MNCGENIYINYIIYMKYLITGCAGFIGSHLCERLLKENNKVIGIDILNDYYDVSIKENNIEILNKYNDFTFVKEDICNTNVITKYKPDKVCHLASMAGVRYSIENPSIYVKTNIEGFINILEQCKNNNIKQLVFASSSSVYGLNKKIPFKETDIIETVNSPYAASKYSMEIFGKTYSQLYDMNIIGLRFFTVYGPRGRPDMAPYKFMKSIKEGNEFLKYGNGESMRDYTYIDDIIDGILASLENNNEKKFEIYNLGNNNPITLNEFIKTCEKVVGKKAIYKEIDDQLGDVPKTCADISKAEIDLNYKPKVSLKEGLTTLSKSL